TNWRDHRNKVALHQHIEHIHIDLLDLTHQANIDNFGRLVFCRRSPHCLQLTGPDQIRILTGQTHGATAIAVDQGHDVLVHQTAKHHLHHIHGFAVGHPHAVDELGINIQLGQQLADLRASTMDHHRINPHQLHHDNVTGKAVFEVFVDHGVAAVLDHDGLTCKTLNIWQRLAQDVSDLRG